MKWFADERKQEQTAAALDRALALLEKADEEIRTLKRERADRAQTLTALRVKLSEDRVRSVFADAQDKDWFVAVCQIIGGHVAQAQASSFAAVLTDRAVHMADGAAEALDALREDLLKRTVRKEA